MNDHTRRGPSTSRQARRLILAAFAMVAIVLVVISSAWAANFWVKHQASSHVFTSIDELEPRTVAIVLGARVSADGRPSAALEDRLQTALDLYESGKVRRLLVSGDHGRRGYDEVNAMHGWLLARGVPGQDIFLDHAGFRTFDTMERAARVFQVQDAIVCTQRFHLDRAVFLARRAGIDAVGISADRRRYAMASRDARREFLARTRAVVDSYLPFTSPRFLGDPIPIDGDATLSHDRHTQITSLPLH
jgi:SanA protein